MLNDVLLQPYNCILWLYGGISILGIIRCLFHEHTHHSKSHCTMLTVLPSNLIELIIAEYLEPEAGDLSRLDVAFCSNRERGEFLAVLSKLEMSNMKCIRDLGGYLNWIQSRSISVQILIVNPQCIADALAVAEGRWLQIEEIIFDTEDVATPATGIPVDQLLRQLPSVWVIDCELWPDITDAHLEQLCSLPAPLRSLYLDRCDLITASTVSKVAVHFSESLEALHCDVLDDPAIQAIVMGKCTGLTSLRLACDRMANKAYLKVLCYSSRQLEMLELFYVDFDARPAELADVIDEGNGWADILLATLHEIAYCHI